MAGKEIDNKPVTTNNNNSDLLTRSAYLEGKTELTDEDIINILDLPSEKPDYTKINIFTNKSFSEINTSETELQNIKQELIKNGDFLKYHDSYVSKSKLLYTETRTLYNELAGIIVLNEINLPSYLLPYGFAKNNKDEKTFADALQKNNNLFTEFKRVFSINSFSRAYSKAKEQSEEVFVSLNPEGMDKNETFKLLIRTINNIKSENKSCSIIFYNEKNKECYWFDINKNGFVTENEIPALKENGLAHSDKPSFAETMQQSTPSTINNIYNNKIIVNNLIFETLLDRGAILELKRNKDIYDRKEKYFNTVNHLESITAFASNDVLKKSNNVFIETEKHTQFYKNLNQNNLNTQGDKTMEKTLQTLNDYYGFSFIAPDYWNNDDISKWNEMTIKDGLNLEIVSMLDFVTEATKVINGEKPLEYINNLDYMKLPKKIESIEELVNQEKQHRNSAYELFQKEYQIETQQNTQEAVADVVSQENYSENVESFSEEKMTFTDKNVRSLLLDYCEPFVKTAYYKELFGEQKNEFTDEEIRKLSKSINLGDLLNTLDEKTLRDFAKDTGIPVSSDDERQRKLIVEGIKRLQQREESEQAVSEQIEESNIEEIIDSGVEMMDANGGLSDVAIEAELAAYENPKPDYLDEHGNPHWFDEEESLDDEQVENTDDADVNPGDFLPVYDGVFNVSEEDQTFLDAMDKEREEHEKWLHETKEGQKKLKEMESEVHEDTKFEGFPVSSQSESNTAQIPENLQKKATLHKFFVENAYKEKTPVPAFGYRNAKTGHIVVLEGWEFSKTETYTRDVWDEEKQEWKADDKERHGGYNSVTDDLIDGIKKQPQFIKDENGNQIENPDFYTYRKTDPIVVLTKMEGDKQIEMRIPAEQYATQIRNSCILKNAAEITEEKLQEYRQKAQLDENEQRPNNAENFTHNFTAFCRKGANSVQEAMDFAIHNLIGNMRPEEREKLKAQMLDWEKKSGKSYTERLTEEYKQNVSDKPIIDKTAFDRNVLDSIRYNTEVIDREGAKLDKSCKLTVGESVKMQLSVPDCLGRKNYKLPIQNLVLVSHCPDNNSVVLMDEKHLSKYILPRDEFIKNVQKYEKKQERSNSRTSRQEERNAISMSD